MIRIYLLIITFLFINICNADEGYYQEPDIKNDSIVFVSDNDLWTTNISGGNAKRITSIHSEIFSPVFSPDGTKIAFVSSYKGGYDIFVVPSEGGEIKRVTYTSSYIMKISEWNKDSYIYFSSNYKSPFYTENKLYKTKPDNASIDEIKYGQASFISNNGNITAIQKIQYKEFGYWKSYRGGTRGSIWLKNGNENFKEFIKTEANVDRPIIIGEKLFYLSDENDKGSLYSIDFKGNDKKLIAENDKYYIRNFRTDGKNIIYTAGGNLYIYSINDGNNKKLDIKINSDKTLASEKFFNFNEFIEAYSPHPNKDLILYISRSEALVAHYFNGTFLKIGDNNKLYTDGAWSHDGKHLLLTYINEKGSSVEIYETQNYTLIHSVHDTDNDFGYIKNILPANKSNKFALINDNGELHLINFSESSAKAKLIEKSPYDNIRGISWSSDDSYISYSIVKSPMSNNIIKTYSIAEEKAYEVTTEFDSSNYLPYFSGDNKYLFFISTRQFLPYRDSKNYSIHFINDEQPYLMTLNKNILPSFATNLFAENDNKNLKRDKKEEKFSIDFENISERVATINAPAANYRQIFSHGSKIWFMYSYVNPSIEMGLDKKRPKFSLALYDIEKNKLIPVAEGVDEAALIKNGENFIVTVNGNFRIISSSPSEQPMQPQEIPDSILGQDGWLNNRLSHKVDLQNEWKKIYLQAFFLLKHRSFTPLVKNINWDEIRDKYAVLLQRIHTRNELNDLMYEMQGELKSSHAYVFGGDTYLFDETNKVGKLGCDFAFDKKVNAYRMFNLAKGEAAVSASPLNALGLNIQENSILYSINNIKLDQNNFPEKALLGLANQNVLLEIANPDNSNKRKIVVHTSIEEYAYRYYDFVHNLRKIVHKATDNKVGYIHIPDMLSHGFVEFYKAYLSEFNKEVIILDVRHNRGGNVSSYIMDVIMRKNIGFMEHKVFGKVINYPFFSPNGKFVLLMNENTFSDGDIFSNAFKTYKLGPIVGKRSWGGVIAFSLNEYLLDNGVTTQPQFPNWFTSKGYNIENYGVEPDIEINNTPEDGAKNNDTQLNTAISEALKLIK